MAKFVFSSLFAADMVAAAFDSTIERDAAHGRVSSIFADALASSFGLALPAAPVAAVKFINELLTLEKAPKLASGPGARAAAPAALARCALSRCRAPRSAAGMGTKISINFR